jgi:hypothetical protein
MQYDAKAAYEFSCKKKQQIEQQEASKGALVTSASTPAPPRRRRLIRASESDDEGEEATAAAAAAPAATKPSAGKRSNKPGGPPSASASTTSTHSIELVEEGDDTEDESSDNHTIQLHAVNTKTRDTDDGATASSMCVRVDMNGIPVGPALVDQGANRSIMRRSAYERSGLAQVTTLWPVSHYQVKTASNHLIPIIGRFMADVVSNGQTINKAATVYVVDDVTDKDKDISCDVVIGRHTIANGAYRLLDTLHGRLVNPDDPQDNIQCRSCTPTRRHDGKTDLEEGGQSTDITSADQLPVLSLKVNRRPRQRLNQQRQLAIIAQLGHRYI